MMHHHKGWNGIMAYESTHYILAIDLTRFIMLDPGYILTPIPILNWI